MALDWTVAHTEVLPTSGKVGVRLNRTKHSLSYLTFHDRQGGEVHHPGYDQASYLVTIPNPVKDAERQIIGMEIGGGFKFKSISDGCLSEKEANDNSSIMRIRVRPPHYYNNSKGGVILTFQDNRKGHIEYVREFNRMMGTTIERLNVKLRYDLVKHADHQRIVEVDAFFNRGRLTELTTLADSTPHSKGGRTYWRSQDKMPREAVELVMGANVGNLLDGEATLQRLIEKNTAELA